MFNVTCPHCQTVQQTTDDSIGKQITCFNCHQMISIPAASKTNIQWYCIINGQQQGPIDQTTIDGLVKSGVLTSEDLVWHADLPGGEWISAAQAGLIANMSSSSNAGVSFKKEPDLQQNQVQNQYVNQQQAAGQTGYQQSHYGYQQQQVTDQAGYPHMQGFPYGFNANNAPVEYAGFWLRFFANLIDSFILFTIMFVVIFGITLVIGENETITLIAQLVGNVAVCLYFVMMESSSAQATWGKQAMGIKVTDMDGVSQISGGRAAGRYFSKIISNLTLGIGYLMAGFTEKKQGLHDMIAGTLVVKK